MSSRGDVNAMYLERPALTARAADGDVVERVNFARERGLLVAVRGGGALGGRALHGTLTAC